MKDGAFFDFWEFLQEHLKIIIKKLFLKPLQRFWTVRGAKFAHTKSISFNAANKQNTARS